LNPEESLDTLIKRTKKMSAELLLKVVEMLVNGELTFLQNDSEQASYNTFPNKEDVKRFEAKGLKL